MPYPTSNTQEAIAAIWCNLLNLREIAPDQSYFDLGGDSLLMVDMIMQVSEEFGLEVDPGLIFEDATLAGFARNVDTLIKNPRIEPIKI